MGLALMKLSSYKVSNVQKRLYLKNPDSEESTWLLSDIIQ